MTFGNFQKICGVKIQIGIQLKLKFDLKKKITAKDLKIWQHFIASEKPIEDKDRNIDKKEKYYIKTKKIDLHGHSLDEAHKKVELLINRSYEEGVEKIIVITGKGLRSKSGEDPYVSKDLSILKYSVPEFVINNKNLKNKIKNISKAKIQDGGEGSFYIFLKKFKE